MAFDNSGAGPLLVPGFANIPIWQQLSGGSPQSETPGPPVRFTHGVNEFQADRMTAREVAMLQLMDSLTDKPRWEEKVCDEAVVARWRAEAVGKIPLIGEAAWEWCVAELRDRAAAFRETGAVVTLDSGSRCVKADGVVAGELRRELLANVKPLLAVAEGQEDWHPGSDGLVRNLVHPSLFPLMYGRTRVLAQGGAVDLADVLASCGQGEVAMDGGELSEDGLAEYWSDRFQWLPCEVEFVGGVGSTEVQITSYINNLHPGKHGPLYGTIEKLIGLSVPLWNDVLFRGGRGRTPLRIKTFGVAREPEMPDWAQWNNLPGKISDPNYAETIAKLKGWMSQPDNPDFSEDSDAEESDSELDGDAKAFWLRLERRLKEICDDPSHTAYIFKSALQEIVEKKLKRIQRFAHPEPGVSFSYEEWKEGVQTPIIAGSGWSGKPTGQKFEFQHVRIEDTFREKGLQVIVKLASIELTPEKPEYGGGSWHLEGMLNEHIVATAIYYYDVENVTPARLYFRQEAGLEEMELRYEQHEHQDLCAVFDTEGMRDELAVQEIGSVATPEGRLLVFPNTLQHSVGSFSLADTTRPGHRRFVVLWLVDPHYRVCSTRNVPPQQHSWWAEEALQKIDLPPLPAELVEMVKREVGEWPMGLEEAKQLRLELMQERTRMTATVEREFQMYNLCEH